MKRGALETPKNGDFRYTLRGGIIMDIKKIGAAVGAVLIFMGQVGRGIAKTEAQYKHITRPHRLRKFGEWNFCRDCGAQVMFHDDICHECGGNG